MKRLITLMLAIIMVLSLVACQGNLPNNPNAPAPEAAKVGDWDATTEWAAEGDGLKVNSPAGGYACNATVEIEDIFEISAIIDAGAQEAGITLTDKTKVAIVNVKLVFADGKATVKGEYSINDMQKEFFTSDAFAVSGAVTLKISKNEGERSLKVLVLEGDKELLSKETDELPSLATRSIKWAGLYGKGSVKFSAISIFTEDPSEKYQIGEINPQPHVENENYVFSEGAICNKDEKGNDLIIVDSQTGETRAWNVHYELGDAWTVKVRAQIGQCAESTGAARFVFGDENNAPQALITCRVDPFSNAIMFENAQAATQNWQEVAGRSKWFNMTSDAFDIIITRHAGDKCLYIQVADVTGTILYSVKTSDFPGDFVEKIKHFGFLTWKTQVQYSNIEVDPANSVEIEVKDNSYILGITDPQYMAFDRKTKPTTWEVGSDVYYQAGSKAGEALLCNVDADTTARMNQKLGSSWKLSMDVRYLKAYSDTNMTRFFFNNNNQEVAFILDIRTIVGTYYCGAQYQHNRVWSSDLFAGTTGALKEDDIRIELSRAAGATKLLVRLLDTDGTVLFEQETPEIPNIDDICFLEIHSSQTITIFDNIVVE